MDYCDLWKREEALLVIPGLGDGLATVKGMAQMLALSYRSFATAYQVYVFSRINELPENYTTRDMATDIAEAMEVFRSENGSCPRNFPRRYDCPMVGIRFPRKS